MHTHRFTPVAGGTELYDNVRYRVPGGPLAPLVDRPAVRGWLDAIFDYRAERLAALLGPDGTSTRSRDGANGASRPR